MQECAANEERQLLEKVAELLASSNARKKRLVCLVLKFAVNALVPGVYSSNNILYSFASVTFCIYIQVQTAVNDLRESATSRTNKLQQEMSTMQESTSSIKAKWTIHMEKTESHYLEDTCAVECGKKDMEEVLQNWYVQGLGMVLPVDFFQYKLQNDLYQNQIVQSEEGKNG